MTVTWLRNKGEIFSFLWEIFCLMAWSQWSQILQDGRLGMSEKDFAKKAQDAV
jgi:hypothetical protein